MNKYSLNVHVISQIILNCVVKVLYSATFLNEICLISFVLLIMFFVNFLFCNQIEGHLVQGAVLFTLDMFKTLFPIENERVSFDIWTHRN